MARGSFWPPSTPDPFSMEAAEIIKGRTANLLRKWIYGLIEKHQPIAEWEIENLTGMAGNTIRPRLWEMAGKSKAFPVTPIIAVRGENKHPRSGRRTGTWVVIGESESLVVFQPRRIIATPSGPTCPKCGEAFKDVQMGFAPGYGLGRCSKHGSQQVKVDG